MRRNALLVPLLLLIARSAAAQASLVVTPPRLEMAAGQKTISVSLKNNGGEPFGVQITAVRWSQSEEKGDVYEPTDDLLFFPKIATIAGGKEQVVRVARRGDAPAAAGEMTYRLLVEQIPTAPARSGVGVMLRVSVPLFVPPARPYEDYAITSVAMSGGEIRARLVNRGNTHVAPAPVAVRATDDAGREVFHAAKTEWYQLAGGERTSAFPVPPADCRKIRTITVTADLAGRKVLLTSPSDPGRCAREGTR